MARRERTPAGVVTPLRLALVENSRAVVAAFPTPQGEARLAEFEAAVFAGAEVVLDADAVFRALYALDDPGWEKFTAPVTNNRQRWLLTKRNELVEIKEEDDLCRP